MNIYQVRRYGILAFLTMSAAAIVFFLWYSRSIVDDLARQERARMQIWADATRRIATQTADMPESDELDFLLGIIEENRTIPVILTAPDGSIIMHRNFDLPQPADTLDPLHISDANLAFLNERLAQMRVTDRFIDIEIGPGNVQRLYFEDSKVLRSLSRYPYVQLTVMIVFLLIVYFAVSASRRAEQNKVWVGLSKETAHQLGTPISSLMAWIELLESEGTDPAVTSEMDKDVNRLATIASRFSKIGSVPLLEPEHPDEVVGRSVEYMRTRISPRIALTFDCRSHGVSVAMSVPLVEWVIENLIKNAADAMEGNGSIGITLRQEGHRAVIDVTDTGRGISRKQFRMVFRPGFTTKKRGWGLGLALAKRIIEEYHHGRIYVKESTPGKGTTFTIELPLTEKP